MAFGAWGRSWGGSGGWHRGLPGATFTWRCSWRTVGRKIGSRTSEEWRNEGKAGWALLVVSSGFVGAWIRGTHAQVL